MYRPPNYLRTYRKKSPLTQKDMVFLLHSINASNVCNVEKGRNPARIELLLVYHLLFDTTVESLFDLQREIIEGTLIQNVYALMTRLKKENDNAKTNSLKIRFLEEVISRLT